MSKREKMNRNTFPDYFAKGFDHLHQKGENRYITIQKRKGIAMISNIPRSFLFKEKQKDIYRTKYKIYWMLGKAG